MGSSENIVPRRRRSLPEQVIAASKKIQEHSKTIDPSKLLSSGSTLLNLACSDTIFGAFKKGKMINIIGDSSSGKSLLCLHVLVEAALSSHFKNYELYYDDIEGGCDFNIKEMLGAQAQEAWDNKVQALSSESVEEWQDKMNDLAERNVPFVYILDSYDVLDSNQAKLLAVAEAKARADGKEVKGTYGMDKVKRVRAIFRPAIASMKKTGGILIIISQTKANIDPMSFKKKTRSAEDALEFHSSHCIWLARVGSEKSKERVIGTKTKLKVKKNRLTGKRRDCSFSIFNDYGIDDLSSCIDFLVDEKYWNKSGSSILAEGILQPDKKATKGKLIQMIEDQGLENKLKRIVGEVWNSIEEELKLNRKSRYA